MGEGRKWDPEGLLKSANGPLPCSVSSVVLFFPDGSDCGFEQAAIEHLPSFPFSFLGDTICSTVVMTYLGHLFKCLI